MKKLKLILAGCAVAFVGLLGVGSANAAFIRGTVDPLFTGSGAAFGYYWTAQIQFDADLSCVGSGFTVLQPGTGCPIPGYEVNGNLNVSATLGQTSTDVNTVSINFPVPALTNIGVFLAGTTPIGISATSAPPGPFGFSSFNYSSTVQGHAWLQFILDSGPVTGLSHAVLSLEICNINNPNLPACTGIAAATSSTGAVVVAVVPEPPIALLLLAALPAVWLVRRRRSAAR